MKTYEILQRIGKNSKIQKTQYFIETEKITKDIMVKSLQLGDAKSNWGVAG